MFSLFQKRLVRVQCGNKTSPLKVPETDLKRAGCARCGSMQVGHAYSVSRAF